MRRITKHARERCSEAHTLAHARILLHVDEAADGRAARLSTASLYAAFPPEEARRIAERLEPHPTPTHGGRSDSARTDRERHRNQPQVTATWQFTIAEVRI